MTFAVLLLLQFWPPGRHFCHQLGMWELTAVMHPGLVYDFACFEFNLRASKKLLSCSGSFISTGDYAVGDVREKSNITGPGLIL